MPAATELSGENTEVFHPGVKFTAESCGVKACVHSVQSSWFSAQHQKVRKETFRQCQAGSLPQPEEHAGRWPRQRAEEATTLPHG